MLKRFAPILMASALLATPSLGQTLACGDTVTSSVTLTGDLDCRGTGVWTALYVPVDGVTIDLDGHTIYGEFAMTGISVFEAQAVRIIGPGRILDFGMAVNAFRSDKLQVFGIEIADAGNGVILTRSPRSEIAYNEFYRTSAAAIWINDPDVGSSRDSGGNLILGNKMGKVEIGIELCGAKAGGNRIEGNEVAAASRAGIRITDHSGGNRVFDNRMHNAFDTGILLESSTGNTLERNAVIKAPIGVALTASRMSYCHLDPAGFHDNGNHKIYDNRVERTDVGFLIGDGFGLGKVFHTVFARNRILDSSVGLLFEANSYDNAAFGTVYGAVVTPVIDLGTGNTW